MASSEVVAVAEDGAQRFRNRTGRRRPTCEILVDAETFERAVQPFRPRRIGVAVGDEGAIFDGDRLGHGCEAIERVDRVAPAVRFLP
jgi:hypothetical protein